MSAKSKAAATVMADAFKRAGAESVAERLRREAATAFEVHADNFTLALVRFMATLEDAPELLFALIEREKIEKRALEYLKSVAAEMRDATKDGGGEGQNGAVDSDQGHVAPSTVVPETPERAAGGQITADVSEDVQGERAAGSETRASAGGGDHREIDSQIATVSPVSTPNPPRDLSAARAERAKSYGQMIAESLVIQGRPLMRCDARSVREWGAENAARARFAERLTANLPDNAEIGVYRDFDFIGSAWKEAHAQSE